LGIINKWCPLIEKVYLYQSHTKISWRIIRNPNILSEAPFLLACTDDKVVGVLRIDSTGEFDLVGSLYSKDEGNCLDMAIRIKFTKNSLTDYEKNNTSFVKLFQYIMVPIVLIVYLSVSMFIFIENHYTTIIFEFIKILSLIAK
jgi:hypothetical protein